MVEAEHCGGTKVGGIREAFQGHGAARPEFRRGAQSAVAQSGCGNGWQSAGSWGHIVGACCAHSVMFCV